MNETTCKKLIFGLTTFGLIQTFSYFSIISNIILLTYLSTSHGSALGFYFSISWLSIATLGLILLISLIIFFHRQSYFQKVLSFHPGGLIIMFGSAFNCANACKQQLLKLTS